MKLIFSIFILSFNIHASMIKINYEGNIENAYTVKKIFTNKYLIPEKLIQISYKSCLDKVDERFLNICINKKGELEKFSSDIKFKVKSLLVFRQP